MTSWTWSMMGGKAQELHNAWQRLWKDLPSPGNSLRVVPDNSQLRNADKSLAPESIRCTIEELHPRHLHLTRPADVLPLRFIDWTHTRQTGAFISPKQTHQLKTRLSRSTATKNKPQRHTFYPTPNLPHTNLNTDFPAPKQRKATKNATHYVV